MTQKPFLRIMVSLYIITVIFWLVLIFLTKYSLISESTIQFFRLLTQVPLAIIPLVGGIFGLKNSIDWGGIKSGMGKSSLFLSLGLIAWASGMIAWNYYIFFTNIEIPYPSLADIGYVLGLLFFVIGISTLSKIVGVKFALRNKKGKFIFFLIPVIVILFSVYLLINVARGGVLVDTSESYLKLFFDILYPLGDVVILTITGLLYFLSKKFLGGVYKTSILVLFSGFLFFYISDFLFSYTTTQGAYFNGHFVDFLFTTTMFTLSLGVATLDPRRVSSVSYNDLIKIQDNKNYTSNNSVEIFKQIIITIIKRQERIAGQIAWEEAKDIDGLVIIDQAKGEISVKDNSNENLKKIADQLVERYKNLFGDIAVEVSKSAVRYLVAELSSDQVPDSLR
ncbi:hypothetical protein A2641_00420 [Candidatus Nomurabacteria bacterium RIFCSPHIGHO2_01_FULL_37_25]|uniref:Uncharacterized protein n=1 Tax=Candidatus Nomurabacteria bacterium RIFCSPLOWO2_01_FULL_36_16 TaxID=1801767 RepID=A0A1F6WZD1_9BACT|nr:MAG: hypothetical protein A2641_00420 [Candidatus Nomurabacteria bacterium RIFCSPHIGHO2_01_FULL_37_25]OGI75873.1 MAG: hypothetical protein A3D36_01205 [Candidatus Nomurabacteria bacterium RIFCSPHIGHO2_02_FULL_36_29]OGI87232.1 MAG: hypothetical protein A3A91_03820 [Candidatus Nomurabacteria bacterium RIFCSPLOWO2_01_FULL_36_16]OGI96192.1 MAG: hypothetical protein A3I84_01480 [Candidatus Nomurabacteria bacterium RIFCSPLOWO2_02_FULL_36_8]